MISVRWSPPSELELEGTDEELSLAAEEIRELPHGEIVAISADAAADPAPYDRVLSLVRVQDAGEVSKVAVDGDRMEIVGLGPALRHLSEALELVARDGGHVHLEWYPEHPFLDPATVPLVITRRETNAC